MIVEVALDDRLQPLPDFGHWLVPAAPKLLLQLTELSRESLTNRLPLDDEPAGLPSLPADVRMSRPGESPSRPGGLHPEALTDSGREPLDSSGSCHQVKAAAFRLNPSVLPVAG
jgi:hypothetical protein